MSTKISTTLLLAASAVFAQQRFDTMVRNDFFAGFTGNREALERGMKKCEEILAAEPKNAEAMVWHGSGVFFKSGEAARGKDYVKAMDLYKRGLDEMAAAVALAPDNIGVLIPRGVFHAHQNLGRDDALLVSMPTRAYDHVNPDVWRLPIDTDQIPYRFESRLGW